MLVFTVECLDSSRFFEVFSNDYSTTSISNARYTNSDRLSLLDSRQRTPRTFEFKYVLVENLN